MRRRKGRGPGSTKGKTAGRGSKGEGARPGNTTMPWFQGGQTPLIRRLPKRGFSREKFKRPYNPLNLNKLIYHIEKGRIDPSQKIDLHALHHKCRMRFKHGIKILAGPFKAKNEDGQYVQRFPYALQLEVSDVSAAARDIIEQAGGQVVRRYFERVTLRAHIFPDKFSIMPKQASPKPKRAHRYDIPAPIQPPRQEIIQAMIEDKRQQIRERDIRRNKLAGAKKASKKASA